jgi:microcystin-dependent protein
MKNWKKGEEGGGMLGRVGRAVRLLMRAPAACALMLMLSPQGSRAQVPPAPDVLPYQGRLVDGNGVPLGTTAPMNYDVVFRIFASASGGTPLWTEQQTVTVDAGRFSVQLGLGAAVAPEPRPSLPLVFMSSTASDRYLEATIKGVGPGGADARLTPRFRMVPSASAMVARHALTADRLVPSGTNETISVSGKRVGINAPNPLGMLDVGGDARVTGLRVNGDVVSAGAASAASWTGAGAVPVGTVILWSGTDSERPAGWALCDGAVVNGFRTPDLRGRFVVGTGAGTGLTERGLGDIGGAETHVLGAEEAPAHAHEMDFGLVETAMSVGHAHTLPDSEASRVATAMGFVAPFGWSPAPATAAMTSMSRFESQTTEVGTHCHGLDLPPTTSAAVGGGQGHPNMPPFYVLAYIVRVP